MHYGVIKIDCDTNKTTYLYDCIETIEEADLLAQYAMYNKKDWEIIHITPGWNRSIKNNLDEFEKALQLTEKYRRV